MPWPTGGISSSLVRHVFSAILGDIIGQSMRNETDLAAADNAVRLGDRLGEAARHLQDIIFGQESVIEESLIALLAGGHGLLVGLPGLAKTKLVESLGVVFGLDTKRVQFTPDLMPADILGAEVLEEGEGGRRGFRFIQGPVFAQLLMADEINRASPRTQSALLQAMQERQVSVAGAARALPQPFHVLATQNPIEQEGTYPLPEAQLDRFLLQISVGYPARDAERRMLIATTGPTETPPRAILTPRDLIEAQDLVRRLPIGEQLVEAILSLVRSARPDGEEAQAMQVGPMALAEAIAWGPGPRAAQALSLAVRARALLQGRIAPSFDDLAALAKPVLRHRMALSFTARAEGLNLDTVIARLVEPYR